ncbi:TPA: hypothetical protein RUZ23_003148 [Vibrio cholerae]|uniref:hypothetical protein n=2 Tax=Vibrio cholerae TaxID=666 RepID=UPI00028C3285|nr:hypothetical protein [Vibrio cholerae]EGQ9411452.1 hypothetical protein [Vibrio cholerae]EGR0490574.1 hypothetical protein [Vibrio cholerae]EGR0501928.1 hypothetical protein [Vibrio cholerae]EGR0589930.1 hypothetical protein [Vibrio cholerae]EGR1108675.1 hypothetical protein [Vibrio cholerae]
MTTQQYSQQLAKVALYRQALPIFHPLPPPELFSFVRIAGQLAAEQNALNASVLSHLTQTNAANDPVYMEVM